MDKSRLSLILQLRFCELPIDDLRLVERVRNFSDEDARQIVDWLRKPVLVLGDDVPVLLWDCVVDDPVYVPLEVLASQLGFDAEEMMDFAMNDQ
jgi:hypothetical protein